MVSRWQSQPFSIIIYLCNDLRKVYRYGPDEILPRIISGTQCMFTCLFVLFFVFWGVFIPLENFSFIWRHYILYMGRDRINPFSQTLKSCNHKYAMRMTLEGVGRGRGQTSALVMKHTFVLIRYSCLSKQQSVCLIMLHDDMTLHVEMIFLASRGQKYATIPMA